MIKTLLTFSLVLLLSGQKMQHDPNQEKDLKEKLKLIHADSLVANKINNEEVTTLFGTVKLVQGKAELSCQKAVLYREKRFAVLEDNVKIFDGDHTLWADVVKYNGEKSIETATGNVRVEINNRILYSDTLIYNQINKKTSAFGNVIVKDLIEHVILYGNEAFYDKIQDYAYIKEETQVVQTDSSTGERMTIRGLRIDAWGEEEKVVITDSVKIVKKDLKADCGKGIFFVQKDTLILLNSPVVKQKRHLMKGDTIDICIRNMNFNGGIIQGTAEIISKDNTSQDELKGNKINIFAENDTIKEVLVIGQASSVYHIKEEDERGKNLLTGDKIKLIFKNDSLKEVNVFSDPGLCTGKYTPASSKGE